MILPLAYDWDVGIEIPVIPKKEKELKNIINIIENINKNSQNKILLISMVFQPIKLMWFTMVQTKTSEPSTYQLFN